MKKKQLFGFIVYNMEDANNRALAIIDPKSFTESSFLQVSRVIKPLFFTLLFFCCAFLHAQHKPLRLLHLTFHKGCAVEMEGVAQLLSIDLTTWFIPALPPYFFDRMAHGSVLYNIGHDRAERIWEKHKNFFDSFDAILTSDTAPLARIFLQNGWKKPLFIWMCNRFDYADEASLDCSFPDQEYYDLFKRATQLPHVTIIAYTPFEHYYAKKKGIDTGTCIIKPCAPSLRTTDQSLIPQTVTKNETFFLPPYHNETHFVDLSQLLNKFKIANFCGRYNGPHDLKEFKGIIHLPYSWSNLAFFENTQLGIPYFVPTPALMRRLAARGNYFHPQLQMLFQEDLFHLSEWYAEDNRECIVYFRSWIELKKIIASTDYNVLRKRVKKCAEHHRETMLKRWQEVFNSVSQQS